MFKKILVANRGEIAIRVIYACKELGIKVATIYSECDKGSLHVKYADEAYLIGGNTPKESYLKIDKIIDICKKNKIYAIHPGYGFLSENYNFVKLCEQNNIKFIGPNSSVLKKMGDKIYARNLMKKAGIPVILGADEIKNKQEAKIKAKEIGYPVVIKASMGGGGRGVRIVRDENEIENAFTSALNEAKISFGSSSVYLEKYLQHSRHIEVQILADEYNNVVYLGERECSIQRKNQKLIEEAPSPVVNNKKRKELGELALLCAKVSFYQNAGTVEFIRDKDGNFYFLEMNTRLQVEHPVTEFITGIDLVKAQIMIAAGEKLKFKQKDVKLKGHSIECRIYAEDPFKNFTPNIGKINFLNYPTGIGVRVDSGIYNGYELPPFYDSLIAKLIVFGENRDIAIERLQRALNEFKIEGIKTTIPFYKMIMEDETFKKGVLTTTFVEEKLLPQFIKSKKKEKEIIACIAAAIIENLRIRKKIVEKARPRSAWRLAGRRTFLLLNQPIRGVSQWKSPTWRLSVRYKTFKQNTVLR